MDRANLREEVLRFLYRPDVEIAFLWNRWKQILEIHEFRSYHFFGTIFVEVVVLSIN